MEGNEQHENNEFDSNEMRLPMQNMQQALDESSIIAITDKYGTITYANKAFCKISKYSKEELIGQNHRILKSGYHPPEFYKGLWHTISCGHIWRGEVKNKAKDGTFYWVKTVIVPFFDDQKRITEFISIRTDITDQKNMQEQLIKSERLSTIGELAARLAHDLRNPIAVIQNSNTLIQMKLEPYIDEKIKSHFEMTSRAIQRMLHQIGDVMDFVHVKPLQLVQASLSEIIKSAVNTTLIPDNVKIIMPENDQQVVCDKERLQIVFSNLMTNAIQAIGNIEGAITFTITSGKDDILVGICDTGPGIPKDVLPKIFDPLFTTKPSGTGLGLSSCKNIVEQHGGTIDVKTKVGQGTSFIVRMPMLKTTD